MSLQNGVGAARRSFELLILEATLQLQKKIIISRLFDSNRAMTTFLFESATSVSLREHPDIIISDSWELSDEQRILVRAALDIWCGSGNVFLWELLNGLSHQNFSRLILALARCRDLKNQVSRFDPAYAEAEV